MREIKFRGKRVDNGEWVYGYYVKTPLDSHRIYWQPFDEATNNTYHEVVPETVGQLWVPSLDLKLFTGDLIKADCAVSGSDAVRRMICKITFGDTGMGVGIWYKGEWWGYRSFNWTTTEVVGNIFDNSDLMQ